MQGNLKFEFTSLSAAIEALTCLQDAARATETTEALNPTISVSLTWASKETTKEEAPKGIWLDPRMDPLLHITAVKEVRELFRMTLKDAKDLVDAARQHKKPVFLSPYSGENLGELNKGLTAIHLVLGPLPHPEN